MPEYLGDPSVLTKEKLKSELLANNVELPSGNPTKDVYVQLYLTKLAGQSTRAAAAAADSFSSDEELPPPALPDTSRSSGRKATRKTDKVRPTELDVTALSDKSLRDELLERGLDVGPIVASTRKLYEKKLQKLLDEGPPQPPPPQLMLVGSESDLYSDREDEVIAAGGPEPVEEPEPAPVVERTVRSREKTVMSTRSHSSQHAAVEKIAASDQTLKVDEKDVLKELFLNDRSGPAGITATCRRPIRGAAGRPVTSSDLWSDDSLFSPKATKTSISSYTQSYSVNRVSSLPPKTTSSSLPPAGQTQAAQRSMSLWIKLFLLAIVATFLFLVYQAMETTSINPFQTSDMEVAAGSTA
ncbi:thymopoietin a isoform X1 [Astatotilapia calliptera]|uniref:Thymopoietin a n=1 Tax=Astatotilapia calliptera TaxID=8154 RepID=A0AAX7SRV1_ASTCA|nr:thymopoietin isoform X1 [Astatotilapia calliptera]